MVDLDHLDKLLEAATEGEHNCGWQGNSEDQCPGCVAWNRLGSYLHNHAGAMVEELRRNRELLRRVQRDAVRKKGATDTWEIGARVLDAVDKALAEGGAK